MRCIIGFFLLAACSEAPVAQPSTLTLKELETTKVSLVAEQAKSVDLAKQLAAEKAKVVDYSLRARAGDAELSDLRIVAETYVATAKQNGDNLVVCDVWQGEGEGGTPVGVSVLIVKGDAEAYTNGEQEIVIKGKAYKQEGQSTCKAYPIVHDSDGVASINWD